MNKSKKERALEISIEQGLLERGEFDVKAEFISDAQNNKIKRSSIYTRVRLKLMLQWNRPSVR